MLLSKDLQLQTIHKKEDIENAFLSLGYLTQYKSLHSIHLTHNFHDFIFFTTEYNPNVFVPDFIVHSSFECYISFFFSIS